MPRTGRLHLRRWTTEDRAPFAALNADPEVMEHFVAPMTRAQSDALADRLDAAIATRGWGLWAVDDEQRGFIGFVGLAPVPFEAPFTPAVEIGWRLARHSWGHGYATEAARAVLSYAFDELQLADVVSFTAVSNVRSQAVMRRIGMQRDLAGDFVHPGIAADHPLAPHVLYRIAASSASGS